MESNTILTIAVPTMMGIIAYFLKRLDNQISRSNDQVKQEIDGLRDDFEKFKDKMPFTYVLREDYIRSMAAFGHKLDKIHDLVVERK